MKGDTIVVSVQYRTLIAVCGNRGSVSQLEFKESAFNHKHIALTVVVIDYFT